MTFTHKTGVNNDISNMHPGSVQGLCKNPRSIEIPRETNGGDKNRRVSGYQYHYQRSGSTGGIPSAGSVLPDTGSDLANKWENTHFVLCDIFGDDNPHVNEILRIIEYKGPSCVPGWLIQYGMSSIDIAEVMTSIALDDQ